MLNMLLYKLSFLGLTLCLQDAGNQYLRTNEMHVSL